MSLFIFDFRRNMLGEGTLRRDHQRREGLCRLRLRVFPRRTVQFYQFYQYLVRSGGSRNHHYTPVGV